MAMSMKEKLLVVWILAVVAFSLVFHHLGAGAIYTLGNAVTLQLVSLPSLRNGNFRRALPAVTPLAAHAGAFDCDLKMEAVRIIRFVKGDLSWDF
jgi:hypothetical protein